MLFKGSLQQRLQGLQEHRRLLRTGARQQQQVGAVLSLMMGLM
jgi:hypothetical protein